ncbi:MAG: sigma-54-dependent Fis family transcriptional regulator [Lentisphaeraceae bacterium]|nr:sigma-54-dependent Fis family transcriptional regulator [Lentisphaeraceae bacterium]
MKKVIDEARRYAVVPRPILIRGERGTGKELMANFIHSASPRVDKPFVTINSAAFNDQLLTSEIYGYEKGAFTGADSRKIGRLEQADGGTFFMDEIGNMSPSFQEKILRVIEYQKFERLNGHESIKVDVRIISATNADLEEMMDENLFRRDLYDRLTFAEINIPPLRQRKEDIPYLIVHFVRKLHEEIPNIKQRTFRRETVQQMMEYYWPGNIRELKNVVERVYLFGEDEVIFPDALPKSIGGVSFSTVGDSFDEKIDAYKKSLILEAYERNGKNQREAAAKLKMTYDQFRHFYRKYK